MSVSAQAITSIRNQFCKAAQAPNIVERGQLANSIETMVHELCFIDMSS